MFYWYDQKQFVVAATNLTFRSWTYWRLNGMKLSFINNIFNKVFPLCTGDRHECHARCREVPSVLWQLSSPDYPWAYTPCRDFLHSRTRARLPWGSDPDCHPDSYVWGRGRWLPSLSHWSRGNICDTLQSIAIGFIHALYSFLNTQSLIFVFPSGNWWGLQTD